MTTEIEQRFFECFGIKPLGNVDLREMTISVNGNVMLEGKNLPNNNYDTYPTITAEKLLELICILTVINNVYKVPKIRTTDFLKYWILEICIKEEESIRTRVRKLFEEEE